MANFIRKLHILSIQIALFMATEIHFYDFFNCEMNSLYHLQYPPQVERIPPPPDPPDDPEKE